MNLIESIVSNLQNQNKCLDMFKNGDFGHLINIKFHEFPSRIMHHVIMRMTYTADNQLTFLIGESLLTFGIKEFAMMSGLNCEPIPNTVYKPSTKENSLKKKFFPDDKKLSLMGIRFVFGFVTHATDEELVKLANLYFLESVLLPKEPHLYINMEHLHILEDLDEFYLYPWGRVVFKETLKHFKKMAKNTEAKSERKPSGYHLAGFPCVVLAFIF